MKIPSQHITGHEAVVIIQRIFASANCVSEVVQNDYGEDLHLQPSDTGSADPFLIGVQVKGINRTSSNNVRNYIKIRLDHMRRWHDNLGPTLLCVHDFSTSKSYVTPAKFFTTRWEYADTSKKYRNINLNKFEELSEYNAERVIWNCRFLYYERSMYIMMGELSDWQALRDEDDSNVDVPADIYLFSTEILAALKIFHSNGHSAQLAEQFLSEVERRSQDRALESNDACLHDAILLALLTFVNEHQGVGMPYTVLKWLTHAAGHWLHELDPSLWLKLESKFPQRWKPYRNS
jgi:hypothetical protein